MSLKLKLLSDPWDDEKIFKNLNREIDDGLHVLVGCNGYGKSTFMQFINEQYRKNKDYKILRWNGVTDTRDGKDVALQAQAFELLANMAMSSEGEEHNINLGLFMNRVGHEVQKLDRNLIILLDAVDSGISADRIEETVNVLAMIIADVRRRGYECHIFVPSNTYEMVYIFKCAEKIKKRR